LENLDAEVHMNITWETIRENVRFEVFTAVIMKNGVFWDVTPCGITSRKTPFFIRENITFCQKESKFL
jgi:hypothetical protein